MLYVFRFLNRHKLVYLFLLLLIYGNHLSDAFLNSWNLSSIMRLGGITGFLVLGEALVILTKGIDVSIGWIASLSTVIIAAVSCSNFNEFLNPISLVIVAIFCAMAMGAFLGFINGISIAILRINPLIATLLCMWIAEGIAMLILRGVPTRIKFKEFTNIGRMKIFNIPIILIVLLVIALILYIILKKFKFGRYLYAVGGNDYAAYLSGINVKTIKIITYTLSGLLASVGGTLMAAWTQTGVAQVMAGYELIAITAVIMGGISMTGGEGNIWDTILATFILVTLRKLFIFGGINPWLLGFFNGLILLLSVYFIQGRIKSTR